MWAIPAKKIEFTIRGHTLSKTAIVLPLYPLLELRASTNLLNFEMIGSWPTHAEKKRRKRYICRARPDQSISPSANNRSFPSILLCPFVEQEPILSFYIKMIAIFEDLISQKD